MERLVVKTKVGEIISLSKWGIKNQQVQGIYTVFNHTVGSGLLDGSIMVKDVELSEANGIIKESSPNVILDNSNHLQYYSLIPRKSDDVTVIVEYTK